MSNLQEMARASVGISRAHGWWALADKFFFNNPGIDKELLTACIRKVITYGPSKDTPVPLIIGARNCAKSTVADPIINVFGEENVLGKPKLLLSDESSQQFFKSLQ